MLGIPAQIAGVKTTVLATPPDEAGNVSPEIVYCAKKCGITYILKAGGAQAVAAMAYGTKSCPKVTLEIDLKQWQPLKISRISEI